MIIISAISPQRGVGYYEINCSQPWRGGGSRSSLVYITCEIVIAMRTKCGIDVIVKLKTIQNILLCQHSNTF